MKLVNACIIGLVLATTSLFGQVGFNNANPDPSSVLDLTGTDKGILIPRMTTAQRLAISAPATGLMVYDVTDSRFYFYNNDNWYAVNALDRLSGSTTITHDGNLTVNGTVSATEYNGITVNGTVPQGGIIMWSGSISAIPDGWALCNGQQGTPDLKDRFIVAAGNTYAQNATGGSNNVTLTASQSGVPAHTHIVTDPKHTHTATVASPYNRGIRLYTAGTGGTTATSFDSSTGEPDIKYTSELSVGIGAAYTGISVNSSTPTNASQPFDNRPLYFALAFIMKL